MRRESILLGIVLLLAGLLKVADPGHFQAMLGRYGLFPAPTLPYVSPLIIVGEVLLGLALLSGRQVRHCLAVCEVLFYTFALAVASVLYRGLQIRCACFGVFSLKVTLWHCLICLAIALYLSWRRTYRSPVVPKT
ncbi:MAG: hypothetical protein KF760_03535 [Candidatus Eremiobacteraeota bacterium]|nr:hypothetical protein [Candidatus Eremiobacteraeota bacterium]MCW5872335.1 hypothetical protein [Candidatus Eremiobacteraeota bacterium]